MNTAPPLDQPEEEKQPNPRSGSLTTLCSLSILGSSLTIAFALYWCYAKSQIIGIKSLAFSTNEPSIFYTFWAYITTVFIAIARLVAVLAIWKLRRIGFYAYVVSCFVGIASDYFFSTAAGSFTGNSAPIAALVSTIFIFLYFTHFKELK